MPSQTLEALIEEASRHLSAHGRCRPQVARPMDGLLLLRQDTPSAFEASLYEPVLCLILQGRKQVSIGDRTLQDDYLDDAAAIPERASSARGAATSQDRRRLGHHRRRRGRVRELEPIQPRVRAQVSCLPEPRKDRGNWIGLFVIRAGTRVRPGRYADARCSSRCSNIESPRSGSTICGSAPSRWVGMNGASTSSMTISGRAGRAPNGAKGSNGSRRMWPTGLAPRCA
jgi:hypothetical protein